MLKQFLFAIAVLLGSVVNAQAQNGDMGLLWLASPKAAPPMIWHGDEGRPFTMEDFRGKVVLLNLWATWCKPCLIEMPTLNQLQRRYKGMGLEVVAVAMDASPVGVKSFLRRNRFKYLDFYYDPEHRIAGALRAKDLPTTYLFSREGKLIARMNGVADWLSDEARHVIEKQLRKPAPMQQEMR